MTTSLKYSVIVIRIHRVQITVQKEPKVDTNLTSTAAEPESTVAQEEEDVLDESPSKLYRQFHYCLCIDCCYFY